MRCRDPFRRREVADSQQPGTRYLLMSSDCALWFPGLHVMSVIPLISVIECRIRGPSAVMSPDASIAGENYFMSMICDEVVQCVRENELTLQQTNVGHV